MRDFTDIIKDKEGFCNLEGVSQDAVEEAENKLNLKFAGDYKDYLLKFGAASFDGHELTGICSSKRLNVVAVTLAERIYNPKIRNDMYVVEDTCFDGIIVWQDKTGNVYEAGSGTDAKRVSRGLAEYYQKL